MKTCRKCLIEKPAEEFYLAGRAYSDGRRSTCRACCREAYRQLPDAARERLRACARIIGRSDNAKQRRRLYYQRIKAETMAAYGGRCVCCGEAEEAFLTIDHVFNDGYIERKSVGPGYQFYAFLRKLGFPRDRYQILCFNCNNAKRIKGICPHKVKK